MANSSASQSNQRRKAAAFEKGNLLTDADVKRPKKSFVFFLFGPDKMFPHTARVLLERFGRLMLNQAGKGWEDANVT